MNELELKADNGSIRFVFISHTADDDGSEGYSLLKLEVYVTAYAFAGMATYEFFLADARNFVDQLQQAYDRVDGTAELQSEVEEFTMTVTIKPDGHASVGGVLRRSFHEPNALKFELAMDQSYFGGFIGDWKALLASVS